MSRRKREINGLTNERDFPHLVELALPRVRIKPARARGDEERPKLSLTVPRPRTLLHGSRCILDRLSAFLSEHISSVLKGGAKVCQRQLVNVVRPLVTEFARNFGREGATPIQRSFDASLLGRVQAVKLIRHNALRHPQSHPADPLVAC
jgi:hypothetical protein